MASNVHDIGALMQGLDGKSRDLIAKIVAHLKSQGNFDELRRDCLEELDKMEAFRQLNQRVESYVATFLSKQEWSDTLSKNQMRDSLRKHVVGSEALKNGSQRLVTQVIEKKSRAFQSRLEGIVQDFICKDKQERQAQHQGRNASQQECTSKTDQDKYSGISKVNDIISQIEHSKVDKTKNEGNSAGIKADNASTSQHMTHSKSDSTQLKSEQIIHDKKTDISSPSDATRLTPTSKTGLTKKSIQSKRIIPKKGGSPRSSSPSDKPSVMSPSTTKHAKTTNHENQRKPNNEGLSSVEATKQTQDTVKISTSPHETGQSLQEKKVIDNSQDEDEDKISVNDRDISGDKVHHKKEPTASDAHQEKQPDSYIESQETIQDKTSQNEPSDDDKAQEDQKQSSPVQSDIDDLVSDVSSVHTSDLSSFDEEVSSVSDVSDDDQPDSKQNTKQKLAKKKDQTSLMFEDREKTKTTKTDKGANKGESAGGTSRKRGRPRKQFHQDHIPVKRESRTRHHETSKSSDNTQGRDKSKRTIKKKRCYSPSSEGPREVCLPSKRTRVSSRD